MDLTGDGARPDPQAAFTPLQADDPAEVAGYRLVARLGSGGMGRVYLSHTQGGRPVAIKVVRPELADDPTFRRRFRREMESARRVRGAYTAELIDGDADADPPWLATLYVPGPSLSEAVARRGPLPVPAVLWLMAGVAEALQAIHAAGVVHRDLKPSNVLLAADGPRVIDFGISLAADLSSYTATGSGMAVGTPQFMAPEQASGGEVTSATDVFALGLTASFAALGTSLYGEGPGVSVLYRIVHSAPDLTQLPVELRPLMARCLAADPADRATLPEIVEWCRERLGDASGAGARWQDITGPEPEVPAQPAAPATALLTTPSAPASVPRDPWAPPTEPAGPPARRPGARLAVGAAVTAAVLVLSVLAWSVLDAAGVIGGDSAKGGSAKGGGAGTSESASAGPSPLVSTSASELKAEGEEGGSGSAGGSVSAAPDDRTTPTAEPHTGLWLDAKNSLSFDAPYQRKDRKGDIRFSCASAGCELTSDTVAFVQIFGTPDAGRSECAALTKGQKYHSWKLAAATGGTQICMRHRNGDIASFVIEVKSTAMPESAFLTADMTIWRADGA
ncbi:serine/threonine-protein kinase [Streptomyces sp. VRA16 Mangrove soil]|uniref:serine/threonine-protein kinase n=1 Tax=Streptomyces sp. VRA16 Mangrove soil TaxID=2817434 RepID=UPI001A9DB3CA|nr:serine/threonine-protein kinase [Streptomyces sp. VRA16 Mangrove soil]MBO1334664.1 serine/threonine protein kinase [Streptomyces sp. VRA16 Mangrove soil]